MIETYAFLFKSAVSVLFGVDGFAVVSAGVVVGAVAMSVRPGCEDVEEQGYEESGEDCHNAAGDGELVSVGHGMWWLSGSEMERTYWNISFFGCQNFFLPINENSFHEWEFGNPFLFFLYQTLLDFRRKPDGGIEGFVHYENDSFLSFVLNFPGDFQQFLLVFFSSLVRVPDSFFAIFGEFFILRFELFLLFPEIVVFFYRDCNHVLMSDVFPFSMCVHGVFGYQILR